MNPSGHFPPTLLEAKRRIAAVRPDAYANTRNALDGAVTGLSPYITHGFVTLPEVLAGVAAGRSLGVHHKLVFELGWREYFQHVWEKRGDAALHSIHEGPLPESAYAQAVPADVREARTGVAAIDMAVRTLYASGHLHNHARMWLASYVVHLRRVHWRAGADWMIGHLLDGDLASNHLSWQWVAGTGSHKPYLFNAANVARYAPAAWHSAGSAIDDTYEALDDIARGGRLPPVRPQGTGIAEPALLHEPPATLGFDTPDEAEVAGRDVWLVHPWALHEAPHDLPADALRLGVCLKEFHRAWPWSAARWAFVGERMAELAPLRWWVDVPIAVSLLRHARSVNTVADTHVEALLRPLARCRPPARLFAEAEPLCASFSSWWTRVTRGVKTLQELPGLAALSEPKRADPWGDAQEALFRGAHPRWSHAA